MFKTLDESKVKGIHLKIAGLSAGGSFLDGYDISIVSIAILVLTPQFSLTTDDQFLLLGSTLIGMIFGGVIIGYLTDLKGRRYVYLWDMLLFILFTVLSAVSTRFIEILLFRLLLGVAIGADYAISPTIISEFSPRKHRGKLLTIAGIAWFVGAASSYGVGSILTVFGPESWRYMFLAGVIPAIIVLLLRVSIPESPRWLMETGREEEALESVRRIVPDGVIETDSNEKKAPFSALFSKEYRSSTIFISVFWFCLAAVTYVIALEGPKILVELGLSSTSAASTASVIAFLAILGSFLTLVFVDRLGRKPITSIGFLGMIVTLVGAAYVLFYTKSVIMLVLLFVVFEISQEFGPGITNSVYPQELFPTSMRATAQGFGTTVSRIGAVVGIFVCGAIADTYGFGTGMILLAVISAAGLVVTIVLGKETKGKSLEDLTSKS